MEGAGDGNAGDHGKQDGDRHRPQLGCAPENGGGNAADQQANGRQVARGLLQRLGRKTHPGRHRHPGEVAERGEEVGQFALQHYSATPADSKLAISLRKLTAACSSG